MNAAAPSILQNFISSEDEALSHGRQGDFYLPNNHLIKPLVPSADQVLSDEARQRLYFHLLRVGELPPVRNAKDFHLLALAYAEMAPLLAQGFPMCSLQRAAGLLTFGYDEQGQLAEEPDATADSYRYHARVWAQCNEQRAIPYIISGAKDFKLYAAEQALPVRILKLLRHINYLHSSVTPKQQARYPITRLWFWGMVFIALLNAHTAAGVVEDFLARAKSLPRFAEQLQILSRFTTAVGRKDLEERVQAALDDALNAAKADSSAAH